MKALVIGGAGPIGSHVVDLLIPDHEVVVLDRMFRGKASNLPVEARLHIGDVRDIDGLADLIEDADIVFQLAALNIRQTVEEPNIGHEVMTDGVANVIMLCASMQKRLILASSNTVYGRADEIPTPESAKLKGGNTVYGAAKIYQEHLCRSLHDSHALEYIALRYFNVYGPRMAVEHYPEALVKWMQAIDEGKPLEVYAHWTTLDLIHMKDVARATVRAAESGWTAGAINVGSGQETSLLELAQGLLKAADSDQEIKCLPQRTSSTADVVSRRCADTEQAYRTLSFKAEIGLADGLVDFVDWWRSR